MINVKDREKKRIQKRIKLIDPMARTIITCSLAKELWMESNESLTFIERKGGEKENGRDKDDNQESDSRFTKR